MKLIDTILKSAMVALLMVFFTGCETDELNEQLFEANAQVKAPTVESAGNNLSFPVIWAEEGITKILRTPPTNLGEADYFLSGEWWFVWGEDPIDPTYPIYGCEPSPSGDLLCNDEKTVPGSDYFKAWLQKDPLNFWEAYNGDASLPVYVDFIDWGDNLESIDWRINSKVRTELVLYENVIDQGFENGVLQYPMRHVSGWGTDEVHGLQTNYLDDAIYSPTPEEDPTFGLQATVYSERTRMTIQKLNVDREDPRLLTQLEWDAQNSQWVDIGGGEPLINEPFFNFAVAEAADGPGYFNAEVNVKGKIIYGYTWDMKAMNEGTGDYRITYSFDAGTGLNTFINSDTQIIVAEEVTIYAEGESGGAGVLDDSNDLTYMDIRIVGKTTGGSGGNSGGNGGGNSGGAGNSDSNGGGNNTGGGGNGSGGKN
ncbi:hypothetical protein [Salegentibacter sp. F14]